MAGPLALLQLGAWSWMVVSYSQDSSLKQAIKETFGDERPCDVCRVIDSAEESQQSTPSEAPNTKLKEVKLMLGLGRPMTIAHTSVTPLIYDEQTNRLLSVSQLVPTPPPRA